MLSTMVRLLLVLLVAVSLTGCAVVGGIFKAGMWVGVVIAVVVIGIVLMLFRR